MTYKTPAALRTALEQRLLNQSIEAGTALDRLRRRVVLERVVARLEAAEPGRWVLKGGMALEARLRDGARVTKDIDLGLREQIADQVDLHERLVDALTDDPHGDMFSLSVEAPRKLGPGDGRTTYRMKVGSALAGKPFGRVQLDVAARPYELEETERLVLPNSLAFAGISAPEIDVIDLHRHAAEKLHAMLRVYGDRENSRVRDLVDLVILGERGLLDPGRVVVALQDVWTEREGSSPPRTFPTLPETWPDRYENLIADLDIENRRFAQAVVSVEELWKTMHSAER